MRVISGKYRGKNIKGYTIEGTRPTMDRVKESLFAMIQTKLKDATVLDLFAGSGNLGIEALSNGAKGCYFVDHNKVAQKTILENLNGIDGGYFVYGDYLHVLKQFENDQKHFDIIFLDPPYEAHYIQAALDKIEEYDLLNAGGLVICEYISESFTSSYFKWKEKKYGTKKITIYQKN